MNDLTLAKYFYNNKLPLEEIQREIKRYRIEVYTKAFISGWNKAMTLMGKVRILRDKRLTRKYEEELNRREDKDAKR